MSSALVYYAKQPQFLPAKACSWVSRDQRLWENSGKHVPHPFSLGEGEQQASSLQPTPGDFPPELLPFCAPLQSNTAAAQSSLAALCWPRPHHHWERRGRWTCPWLVKPLSVSPPQQGLSFHCTSPSGSPAHPHPPACLHVLPISDSQMSIINTEKGRH